ncbi:MAG: hypothetical protein Q8P50_03000 [Bacillota bacterium]|nr:hypothetical protein [Bacillota bacterium]
MARTYYQGSLVDYAFALPSRMLLAVPQVPQTLPQIMEGFSLVCTDLGKGEQRRVLQPGRDRGAGGPGR